MRERIKIGEIRKAVTRNKEIAGEDFFAGQEKKWLTHDAPISGISEKFDTSFGETFLASLPKEYFKDGRDDKMFKKYIESTLQKGGTAVEFGGPGSNLFSGFTDNFFKKTVGVCLDDIRSEDQKRLDAQSNHSVIVGDILDPMNDEILHEVIKKLGKSKTDLIISRMMGPLDHMNKNGAILDRIMRNWYSMLKENGLMFIQFNFSRDFFDQDAENLVEKWATVVREKFPEIDIQLGKGIFRLHKKIGAPEKLPPATQLFQ